MITRNRPAHWEAALEQADLPATGSFRHLPVTWSGRLAVSFIRAGVMHFGATLRHNPLGGDPGEDPFTVPAVTVVEIDDPDSQRDQGEADPLYPMP